MVRAGLRLLIDTQPDMAVVGEAGDEEAADLLLDRQPVDLVVIDLDRRGAGTPSLIERITQKHPPARVLVLASHDKPRYLRSCLAAGAAGFLVKQADDTKLIAAIRRLHRGQSFIQPDPGPSEDTVEDPRVRSRVDLSVREMEVLALLAAGLSYNEAAARLHVKPRTIDTYRTRLGRKLGVHSRAGLVAYAMEMHLLKPIAGVATGVPAHTHLETQ
jgi:DNA-binding NarL/FixJ family response regulator